MMTKIANAPRLQQEVAEILGPGARSRLALQHERHHEVVSTP